MRLFHISDTHLGFSAYRKVSPETGLNQREQDVYDSLGEFIDIAIAEKPDLIIHAGDLFDSVRPSNRAIVTAFSHLLRLSDAGIPVVIISGNHETPRLRETGSIFRIFDHVPGLYPVYRPGLESIEMDIDGMKVMVHALPHIGSEDRFKEEFASLKPEKGAFNIAVLHGSLVGLDLNYITGDFNEIRISSRILTAGFDYIALGHYHEFTRIENNCIYSGSTDHMSFSEAGKAKGFADVLADAEGVRTTFRELGTREMRDLGRIDARNTELAELTQALEERIGKEPLAGIVARLRIINVPKDIYRTIDHNRLERMTSEALYFQFNWELEDDTSGSGNYGTRFRGLQTEFGEYMDRTIVEGMDKERLKRLGAVYLERAGVKR